MRLHTTRIPMVLVALAPLAMAQVTPEPRRISRSFSGQIPMVWMLEGEGLLQSASYRVLDDRGAEVQASRFLTLHAAGKDRWQAVEVWIPSALPALEGRLTVAWNLTWLRGGQTRTERVEHGLRLGAQGDGWLQRAFEPLSGGTVTLEGDPVWLAGGPYRIGLRSHRPVRGVQIQVIASDTEQVLMPWRTMDLKRGLRWRLDWERSWPTGPLVLWVQTTFADGTVEITARELADAKGAKPDPASGGPVLGVAQGFLSKVAPATTMAPADPSASVANLDPLRPLDEPDPLPWDDANRVATVQVGYLDEERNHLRPWPTDTLRPMSLSLSGSDHLGKPLYTLSYLLRQRAQDGEDLAVMAESAARNVASGVLPEGAAELTIGRVPTVVAVSPGKVEDFLGKPLAQGYGWALHEDGVPLTAEAWVQSLMAQSPSGRKLKVGVAAMVEAARLRARMIQDDVQATGYAGAESTLLDATRDPYGLTLASQDPLGRVVLSKPMGGTRPGPLPFRVLLPPPLDLVADFTKGMPVWAQVKGTLDQASSPVAVVLAPPRMVIRRVPSSLAYYGSSPSDGSVTGRYEVDDLITEPGSIRVDLGKAMPGAQLAAKLQFQGPIKVSWLLDTGRDGTQVVPVACGGSPASFSLDSGQLQVPAQVALLIENGVATPVARGQSPDPASLLRITGLEVHAQLGALGLEAEPSVLRQPIIPGCSRTQYGSLDIPGQGLCAVTMVTDPDGSAVAEVKDPEGRTVYKIVNPDATYTDLFRTHLDSVPESMRGEDADLAVFQPASPSMRGSAGNETLNSSTQMNLVTQYVFDAEGHLRVVIPPLGRAQGQPWGLSGSDPKLGAALAWDGQAPPSSPIPFATYNAYDQSGHLVATFNPDEGLTRFWVDQKGRVHFSQSEGQRARSTYTRTWYDRLYRVVAVAETSEDPGAGGALDAVAPVVDAETWVPPAGIQGLSRNTYDSYGQDLPSISEESPLVFFGRANPRLEQLLPHPDLWRAFASGHLTRTQDDQALERYYYDQDGRIVIRWVTFHPGDTARRQDFGIGIFYDFAGRVKRLVYPDGPGDEPLQVVYTYDELGRLFSVGTPQDKGYFARYAYQPTGEVRAIIYGPGEGFVAKRMLQDPQGWLRSLTIQAPGQPAASQP